MNNRFLPYKTIEFLNKIGTALSHGLLRQLKFFRCNNPKQQEQKGQKYQIGQFGALIPIHLGCPETLENKKIAHQK